MVVYRITKSKYQNDLSGEGARLFGGRWNRKGTPALYTSESRALCILELLVHTQKEILPPSYIIQSIEISSSLMKKVKTIDMGEEPNNIDWRASEELTKDLGQKHFQKSLGIKVPSAIVTNEFNFVLNPLSSNYSEIKIIGTQAFDFDNRLIQ